MTKSTVKKATAAKAETKAPVVKTEEPKVLVKEPVKAEVKAAAPEVKEEKAAPAKKTPAKKAPVKKEAAPKAAPAAEEKVEAPAKKAPEKKAAKKAEVKANVSVQFSGKDYSVERLVEIAKDVWQYDLGKKAEDFATVELYVKTEESAVYYVINGDTTGSFNI